MDKDGNKVIWTVVIISAIAIIGLMFINFMPSQTSNIKTAIGNEISSVVNGNKSNSSSSKSSSSRSRSSSHTAVGTNLLLNTGNNSSTTGTNNVNQTAYYYPLANGYNVSSLASALGPQFTISFDWSVSGSSPSGSFVPQWCWTPWDISQLAWTTVSNSNTSGHISHTFSVSSDSKNVANMMGFRLDNFVGTLTVSNIKLEKGSVATPWCPNPADHIVSD